MIDVAAVFTQEAIARTKEFQPSEKGSAFFGDRKVTLPCLALLDWLPGPGYGDGGNTGISFRFAANLGFSALCPALP